ncbi:MAG: phosphoglycerate kinase [Alphaproteobacteria bacterium]|jgi:phosphoglycerate kinase|nr:phosphoglycerate kinase [Alphaproteobacteria bacterium]MBT4084052.1 phosphoglycerate kinase [Alphaproteobacteria bacterium]MBT4545748.1 phosphoglycerate kinase [Alphaproteobacteria bacterium]MBT7744841.1 phosphoglycerate kinase [Alphaproteobacteria bacterium]
MGDFNTLDDFDVNDKRVMVRADLNVPMRDGEITDFTRIDRLVPTLAELSQRGAKVIILSHFGRPKGQNVPEMSLESVAQPLADKLGIAVDFAENCIGDSASDAVNAMAGGDVVLLENLRFHAGEEQNDKAFAEALAANADIYVNDAFSCAHRAHASTEALARLIPSGAGRGMEAELKALTSALETPERPVAAVVGGAKVSTKLDLLGNLIKKVDVLVIGGGMANTFLHARGIDVGNSLCEADLADTARKIDEAAKAAGCEIVLPDDVVVAKEFKANAENQTVAADKVPSDTMILDVGPAAAQALADRLSSCKTLVWNGPLGAFEIPPFNAGTNSVANAAAELTSAGKLVSVAGGGDTVAALAQAGAGDKFTYLSAAGGAFLEWLEGKDLPGVAALKDAAA